MDTGTAGYPEPPRWGTEVATLLGSLERQRSTFAWKSSDLDAVGLRHRIGTSAVTLGGLLKHLAFMEDLNFTRDVGGASLPPVWSGPPVAENADRVWTSAADDTPEALRGLWAAAVTRSRDVVTVALAARGLDTAVRTHSGPTCSLRRRLVDMIEEYARHNGQADLLRETVDGRVGEDPPGPAYPYRPQSVQPGIGELGASS